MEHIERAVAMYFSYAMLSHRWEENEPRLQDVQDRIVYHLKPVDGVVKLQEFCKTARDAGYRWAWIDTCCIDQTNNVEVQASVNSMFVWYRHSALTIVYLSDVPPSSKPGALARSVWNKRGWTVQEFLAPETIIFYQNDWMPYLGDPSRNHKDSSGIIQELADATGIDAKTLVTFHPGMRGAREKLQWVSMRVTTLQEDIAYSLFGIFGIHLPVIYGEKKQHALGRLLQEIVARSGDISALNWVGKSSEFNSCLPADIASYKALPHTLPSLSEDQIQTSISSLRRIVAVDSACKLYSKLENLSAPRFSNCRLHLPCITFPVTEVIRGQARNQEIIYEVKVNGLMDLLIITEDKLPAQQTLLLVYPWNRDLLELPNPAHDTQSVEDYSVSRSLDTNERGGTGSRWRASRLINRVRQHDSESHMRALRLIVRLGQPFRGFLLAQHGGEYRRIATDYDIIAQVQEMTSVRKMMDVRTIEIL